MSYELIALLMFSTMMLMLLTGQRVFGAIGFVAVVAALLLWASDEERRFYERNLRQRGVDVIDCVLPLAELAEGHRIIEDREVFGKVVVRPSR